MFLPSHMPAFSVYPDCSDTAGLQSDAMLSSGPVIRMNPHGLIHTVQFDYFRVFSALFCDYEVIADKFQSLGDCRNKRFV